SVDAAAVKVTGTVRMTGGGTDVIPFTGLEGQFRVRDIAGLHTVVVPAETALATAEASTTFEAVPPGAASLTATPANLSFATALGPTAATIDATFKLVPESPQGTAPRPLKAGFELATPVGEAELIAGSGGKIRINGPASLNVPPVGTNITVRINLHPLRPLPQHSGKQ